MADDKLSDRRDRDQANNQFSHVANSKVTASNDSPTSDTTTICYQPKRSDQIRCTTVPEKTKKRLDKLFNEIDADKKGTIDIKDLTTALERRGHKASKKHAQVGCICLINAARSAIRTLAAWLRNVR